MKSWMMALITRVARKLMSVGPYTASRTFIAPVTTSKVESITGKGADGTPASSGTTTYREDTTITLYRFSDKPATSRGPFLISRTVWNGQPLPGDYCDPESPGGDIIHPDATSTQQCFYFDKVSESYSNPATTGASVTAFGKTFPGGVGKAAVAVTFTDIPVTGGSSHPLSIPSGGSITSFTYYE